MSELDDLRSATRALLEDHGQSDSVWKRLSAEMGLTALPVEDAPLTWLTAVLEETGRVLLRAPQAQTLGSAGRPSARSPMILRWIWLDPP